MSMQSTKSQASNLLPVKCYRNYPIKEQLSSSYLESVMELLLFTVLSLLSAVLCDDFNSSYKSPFDEPIKYIDVASFNETSNEYNTDDRIIGGQLAQPGQFAYQAGLYLYKANNEGSSCGGTLITNIWILSASHCTWNIVRAEVILGTTDMTQRPPGSFRAWANYIQTHPNYRPNSKKYDISLIRFPPVQFSNTIRPVYIAVSNTNSYVGTNVIISGYGRIADNTNTNRLYYTYTTIINLQVCSNFFGSALVDNSMMCARTPPQSNRPQSACRGDSGGPVFVQNYGVVGIVSYGPKSCVRREPEVYHRINNHRTFIRTTTGINFT